MRQSPSRLSRLAAGARRMRNRREEHRRRPAIAARGSTRSSTARASQGRGHPAPRPMRCRPTAGRPQRRPTRTSRSSATCRATSSTTPWRRITRWDADGGKGCNYCHNPANLASDEKYTKVVARRMIQMTRGAQFQLVGSRQADRRDLLDLPSWASRPDREVGVVAGRSRQGPVGTGRAGPERAGIGNSAYSSLPNASRGTLTSWVLTHRGAEHPDRGGSLAQSREGQAWRQHHGNRAQLCADDAYLRSRSA